MAKSPEELEKMFGELAEKQEKSEKEFQLKLDSAEKNAKQYKEIAEKTEEQLRTFKQESEKAAKEQKEALAKKAESEISEFVESQVKAGRILPAFKEKFTAFMKSLTSEQTVLEFTEKNGSKLSHTQISLFKELITKMKPVVPVESELSIYENSEQEQPEGTEEKVETFAEVLDKGQMKRLPIAGQDLAAKASQFVEAQAKLGRVISYGEALIAVSPKKSAAKA